MITNRNIIQNFKDTIDDDFLDLEIEIINLIKQAKQEERERIINIIHKIIPQKSCEDCGSNLICIEELFKHLEG